MGRGYKPRSNTKVVSGGHSTRIEGLDDLMRDIEQWPEVHSIRPGLIVPARAGSRPSKQRKYDPRQPEVRPSRGKRARRGGGGFRFWAIRPAMIGDKVTGVYCKAQYGRTIQEVILYGPDHEALEQRLDAEGYGRRR